MERPAPIAHSTDRDRTLHFKELGSDLGPEDYPGQNLLGFLGFANPEDIAEAMGEALTAESLTRFVREDLSFRTAFVEKLDQLGFDVPELWDWLERVGFSLTVLLSRCQGQNDHVVWTLSQAEMPLYQSFWRGIAKGTLQTSIKKGAIEFGNKLYIYLNAVSDY